MKTIRIIFIWVLGILATLNLINNLHAKKISSDDISNMIIEGESRLKVKPQVPELAWNVNVYDNVGELMKDNSAISGFRAPAVNHPPMSLPEKSFSDKAASPWLARMYEPPILTLATKAQENAAKQEWAFLIKDSRGKVFYEDKSRGELPKELVWNGFGDSGEPLRVGFDYNYTLSIQDEGGNPQRFSGKPFRVDAFRYNSGGRLTVIIDPGALFTESNSAQLSEGGLKYVTEAKDAIRNRAGETVRITTYADDAKFAESRSAAIKKVLLKALDLEGKTIQTSAESVVKGGGYPHVEITVR